MKHCFVHIGDTHLHPGERNDTKRGALEQILREGSALTGLAAWLWPGDLAHSRMATDDLNFLADFVQRLTARAPLVLLPGNHDLPGSLDVFSKLQTSWPVYLATTPQVLHIRTATNAMADIAALPYPSRAGLVAIGTPSERVPEAARQALDTIFMSMAGELAAASRRGVLKLAIAHVNVAGSIASSGQPVIGKEIELDPTLIQRLGPIPFLANHIHRPQVIAGVQYAGSIAGMDFGEREEKSYVVLEMEDDGSWATRTQPLDVPRLYHVEGRLTRDGFDYTFDGDSLQTASPPDNAPPGWGLDCTGGEIRVRFRFAAAEKAALDFSAVTAPFIGAKRIVTDPIAEHTRALRAPAVAQAQSLEQKVEAFVRGAGIEWTGGLQTKLAALQVPDGAAFPPVLEEQRQEVCQ